MENKLRQWLFVAVLGVALPGILLNILPQKQIPEQQPETKLEETSTEETIRLLMPDGSVSELALESYVTCVVLAEMPADFEIEALKAQAVLARTYALKRHKEMDKHAGAVCTEASCCQGYCPVSAYQGDILSLEKVRNAVAATQGQVLTYGGELIEATYFSCSGGWTEDASAVWGADVPYLQATESPGEEQCKHYTSTTVLDQQACLRKLGLSAHKLTISDIRYTDGGGVETVSLCGQSFTGVELRQLLGLKSTAFRMNVVGDSVIITAKGYGHRVGMSQYGADAMAVGGSNYEQILAHYYKGTVLTEDFR